MAVPVEAPLSVVEDIVDDPNESGLLLDANFDVVGTKGCGLMVNEVIENPEVSDSKLSGDKKTLDFVLASTVNLVSSPSTIKFDMKAKLNHIFRPGMLKAWVNEASIQNIYRMKKEKCLVLGVQACLRLQIVGKTSNMLFDMKVAFGNALGKSPRLMKAYIDVKSPIVCSK
ncbi:hypothetical protein H5410_011101 [Solanum commersonii]|uniref:Uncharacterized protein n=1 Tax=Solanum commersonii TaxID=4109 RepID=A0A9J6ANP4_SOLCO|nr:hypothetical protein H5410_011101 [Solanum commersonii]